MPAMTNLLVKDDTTTPVEFTLIPVTDNPMPMWRGNATATPLEGQPRYSVSQTKLKNGNYKLVAKLEVPVMETLGVSGTSSGYVAPPKVAHTLVGIFTMFCDKRSTSSDRANVVRMSVGLLQGASATTGTGLLQNSGVGGVGDSWKNSVLPITSAFVNLVQPN